MRLNMLPDHAEVLSDLGEVIVVGTYASRHSVTPSRWTVWDATHLQSVEFNTLEEALEWKQTFH